MADRIKGITIEIGGDTTKLSDSLKDVNKSIKSTQSELKDVNQLLKLDPSNIDLLVQKQGLLEKATADTKEKLDKLNEAMSQMKASGVDETSEEYRALEREIVATEQEMKKLGDEALDTDKKIIKVASNTEKLANSTEKMAKATSGFSKAASGVLVAMGGLAVKTAQEADELNTMAKQTGLTTESLQKMKYASDLIDVNVDDITGALKKMKSQFASGGAKFDAIGVSIKDANGQLRNTEDIFYDTIQALGKIENETERDTVAMKIFGKSADSLAGLLDDGGEAFKKLGQEAEKNGSIISDEQLQKANELNDTLDKMKQQLGTAFAQLGVSSGEALAPVLEALLPVIQSIAEFIKGLSPETIKMIALILSVVGALSPLLSLISTIAKVIPIISVALTALSGPIGIIILAIGALIAIGVALYENWDTIVAKVTELGSAMKEKWNSIKETISGVWDGLKSKASDLWANIKGKFSDGWTNIKNLSKQKLEFPKIKLPHFSITGSFSLSPPSIPHIGVKWYKKAYDDAYLLNSPTIFGAQGGQLLGGGEGNGSEAVVGTDKLMSMMSDVVANQSANVTVVLEGDAQEVFRLVRTENSKFYKSNGYNPLMV